MNVGAIDDRPYILDKFRACCKVKQHARCFMPFFVI